MSAFIRPSEGRIIGGVCQGIANKFNWDRTIVRVVFVIAAILGWTGVWVYLALWAVMPTQQGTSGIRSAREAWDKYRASKASRPKSGNSFNPYDD